MKSSIALLLIFVLTIGCQKAVEEQEPTYDKYGNQTHMCSIRDAKGHGPYEDLGKMSSAKCMRTISKLCTQVKYKQVHKHKGHFARGKFKEKIMIGTCP